MTSTRGVCLYTEARLNIEATSAASTLYIPTASQSSTFATRKRSRGYEDASSQNEEDFARRHIASDASIFFRSKGRSPRSILWRTLDESRTLELQCVDLIQDHKQTHESLLTFSLSFANPIRPNGVALADNSSHDALEVFVLTTSNELFTFSLRRDLLLRATVPTPAEFEASANFKTHTLSSFSFRHPYKLVALSDLVLAVSLHDGTLLRLERRAGEDGAHWRESYFSEGGWGTSFRGLLPWKGQNTVRYGNIDLAPATAAAIQASPSGEHVFTVSLDHTLKAWNASTGKVGFQIDLLGEQRTEGRLPSQYLISPNQDNLMKIVDIDNKPDGDSFYCIVYSPKEHCFKFWAVRDPDSAEYGLRDIFPGVNLVPPIDDLMDTKVWNLVDFDIAPGAGGRNTTLWVTARSGAQCQTFTITFDMLETASAMSTTWNDSWMAVDEGSQSAEHIAKSLQCKLLAKGTQGDLAVSLADEWLDFLTFPGRFTAATLETALGIYRKGQGLAIKTGSAAGSYQERLRSAITAKIGLSRDEDGHVDLVRYSEDMNTQWKMFFGVVKHLHSLRGDFLRLALDAETGLCWSIRTDQVGAIRQCSDVEAFLLNSETFAAMDDNEISNLQVFTDLLPDALAIQSARLILAARSFRAGLSAAFNRDLPRLASAFALHGVHDDATLRQRKSPSPLQQLYEQCDFAGEVGDQEFDALTQSVEDLGGLGFIGNTIFEAAIELLTETPRGQQRQSALARYGATTTSRVAQDTLIEGKQILIDLLALVTFMSQDLETDELSSEFKPLELYSIIVAKLKEYDVLLWMASNTRSEVVKHRKESSTGAVPSSTTAAEPSLSILESIFIGDWAGMAFPEESMAKLITYWSRAWTFGSSLDEAFDGVTAHVMSNLIKHGNYRLAADFARVLPANSWTSYLKGRMYLGEGEYALAAASLRRSAEELSRLSTKRVQPMETVDTAGLLSATQRQHFNAGLPRYYLHCSSLFEHDRLPAYAADFAAAALQSIEPLSNDDLDSSMMDIDTRKQSMLDSPAATRAGVALEEIKLLRMSELKEEVSSRLFNASLQIKRYETAFKALTQFINPTLKRASLSQLLTSVLATSPSLLTTLPFPADLVHEVDAALLSLFRKHATSAEPGPSHAAILYAWRMSQDNVRGAAEALHEHLQALKSQDTDTDDVLDTYLLLINTLACCGPDEGWILAENDGKRAVFTLAEARAEYQAELDRRSELAHGRFALMGEGAMEVDVF